jgi:DNA-binding response OmpR family regulator
MKILIVEDLRKLGLFLKQAFVERAYTAVWVGSCAEVREALCETNYDVIVLDIGLPDGDGLTLLREWRSAGFNEPVLILSACDAVEDRIGGLDVGQTITCTSRSASKNSLRACDPCYGASLPSRRRCCSIRALSSIS